MHTKPKDFSFEKRAAVYDRSIEGKISNKFYQALLERIKLESGQKLLDVGCGTGRLLKELAHVRDIQGYGIDSEENMINQAKQNCPTMDIRFALGEDTPFGNESFHILTACLAYHHFSNKQGFAQESARILKYGGCLYIADVLFPLVIRRPLNGCLKHMNIASRFSTPQEISRQFEKFGLTTTGVWLKGYIQIIELKKYS